jgi:hypothetical protein
MDLFYLEDQDLARQLVELGYRGSGETLKVGIHAQRVYPTDSSSTGPELHV